MGGERYCKKFTGKKHGDTAALIFRSGVHCKDCNVVQVYFTLAYKGR